MCAFALHSTLPPKSQNPLNPSFPTHTSYSSVTPLFPTHTKIIGGGGDPARPLCHGHFRQPSYRTVLYFSAFTVHVASLSAVFPATSALRTEKRWGEGVQQFQFGTLDCGGEPPLSSNYESPGHGSRVTCCLLPTVGYLSPVTSHFLSTATARDLCRVSTLSTQNDASPHH